MALGIRSSYDELLALALDRRFVVVEYATIHDSSDQELDTSTIVHMRRYPRTKMFQVIPKSTL